MNEEPPFEVGQRVRYKADSVMFAGQERTVNYCEDEGSEWIVHFTDGPFAPNGKQGASDLEAVPSPEPEPKFKLKQRVKSYAPGGSQGMQTGYVKKICMHEDGTITYMTDLTSGWLDESRLQEVEDTVTIELTRSSAEKIADYAIVSFLTDFDKELIEAARKALGR